MSASNDALTTRLEESELRGSQIKKKRMSEDLFYGGLHGLLYYDLCRMKVLRDKLGEKRKQAIVLRPIVPNLQYLFK